MKKIAVVTATRAEYGLLAPVIKELRKYEDVNLRVELIVTGTHLSEKYGNTIQEIEADGVRIDHAVPISINSESILNISLNQADTLVRFTELFLKETYAAVMLLGDRYETLAIAIAAGNTRTPIFHLSGGDTSEGAIDEWIRHSITKISYLHFPTNEESRKRIIQMGEIPDHVFNYGSTSIDNVLVMASMSKEEALESVGLKMCHYAICTYHPVTMDKEAVDVPISQFLQAIDSFKNTEFIITKSNADQGGARINELLDHAKAQMDNVHVFPSLGVKRYLSLMKYADFVIGNSSSGIVEAPALKVPTINIGDRQRGRLQLESIINCAPDTQSIIVAIKRTNDKMFQKRCKKVVSPYGNGHAAEKIAEKTVDVVMNGRIDLKKKFYNTSI